MNSKIGTGPNYSTDTAEQGAPGFNERYYLNENTSAKEAVDAGTYATGLEHYLAEGKDAGLKSFAPFTKVHGYSGNDNIVLREGNETALGYGGNDTIEGGAGNDTIDGGAGSDTAVFRDTYESYTLNYNDDGRIEILDNNKNIRYNPKGELLTIEDRVKEFLDANPHFRKGSLSGTGSQSSVEGKTVKPFNIQDLDMSKAEDRQKYAEYRKQRDSRPTQINLTNK